MSDDKQAWAKSLGLFTVILTDLVGFTGAGIGLGYLAWKKGGAPIWVLPILGIGGLTIAMIRLYRWSQRS